MIKKTSEKKRAGKNQTGDNQPLEDNHDRYLDLNALSRYSSLSVRSLRHYLSLPLDPIPGFQVEKKILVKKSEFDTWMQRRRRKAPDLSGVVDQVLADFEALIKG